MTFDEELTFTEWHRLLSHCMPGTALSEGDGRLRLLRAERSVCVVELPGRWRARERRALHRLGFRRLALSRLSIWRWTASPEDLRAAAEAHPLLNGEGPRTRVHERLALSFGGEQLMRDQVRRVLADVFGFEPGELCLELPVEEEWEEPDEEDVRAS